MGIAGQPKLNLTPKEKHTVGDYILKHCTMAAGQSYAKWDEESGGTDVSAAEKLRPLIPKITVYHVRYLRQHFDLPLEPARLVFQRFQQDKKLTELEQLRDRLEALIEHVKACDVRIKDHESRLQNVEDKYTAPKR